MRLSSRILSVASPNFVPKKKLDWAQSSFNFETRPTSQKRSEPCGSPRGMGVESSMTAVPGKFFRNVADASVRRQKSSKRRG